MSAIEAFVKDLCDRYAHFGEYVKEQVLNEGVPSYGVKSREFCSQTMLLAVYNGRKYPGPESSKALGRMLNVPDDHYMKLGQLFKAEKLRRSKL